MRKTRVLAATLALTSLQGWAAPHLATAQGGTDESPSSLAEYNGRTIDLSVSWEGAQACRIAEPVNQCFDSEAELGEFTLLDDEGAAPLASCSSAVRLYDATSYGTPVLELWPRWSSISLSTYGFSKRTSSYKIGACPAEFLDSSGTYPGSTGAGASSSSMSSGWNNRVTTVVIY